MCWEQILNISLTRNTPFLLPPARVSSDHVQAPHWGRGLQNRGDQLISVDGIPCLRRASSRTHRLQYTHSLQLTLLYGEAPITSSRQSSPHLRLFSLAFRSTGKFSVWTRSTIPETLGHAIHAGAVDRSRASFRESPVFLFSLPVLDDLKSTSITTSTSNRLFELRPPRDTAFEALEKALAARSNCVAHPPLVQFFVQMSSTLMCQQGETYGLVLGG